MYKTAPTWIGDKHNAQTMVWERSTNIYYTNVLCARGMFVVFEERTLIYPSVRLCHVRRDPTGDKKGRHRRLSRRLDFVCPKSDSRKYAPPYAAAFAGYRGWWRPPATEVVDGTQLLHQVAVPPCVCATWSCTRSGGLAANEGRPVLPASGTVLFRHRMRHVRMRISPPR